MSPENYNIHIRGTDLEKVDLFSTALQKNLEEPKNLPEGELEKTHKEKELIALGVISARKFIADKTGVQLVEFPDSRFKIYGEEGLKEISEQEGHPTITKGMASLLDKIVFLPRTKSDLGLTLASAHEYLHLVSPTVFYVEKTDTTRLRQIGLVVYKIGAGKDSKPQDKYAGLKRLEEAIVGRATKLMFDSVFEKDPRFKKEIQAGKRIKDYFTKAKNAMEKDSHKFGPKERQSISDLGAVFPEIITFNEWQTLENEIRNPLVENIKKELDILSQIINNDIVAKEGHVEEKIFLDNILKDLVQKNTARGGRVKQAKTQEGAFWLLARANFNGRLIELAKKLKAVSGDSNYLRKIAEGTIFEE